MEVKLILNQRGSATINASITGLISAIIMGSNFATMENSRKMEQQVRIKLQFQAFKDRFEIEKQFCGQMMSQMPIDIQNVNVPVPVVLASPDPTGPADYYRSGGRISAGLVVHSVTATATAPAPSTGAHPYEGQVTVEFQLRAGATPRDDDPVQSWSFNYGARGVPGSPGMYTVQDCTARIAGINTGSPPNFSAEDYCRDSLGGTYNQNTGRCEFSPYCSQLDPNITTAQGRCDRDKTMEAAFQDGYQKIYFGDYRANTLETRIRGFDSDGEPLKLSSCNNIQGGCHIIRGVQRMQFHQGMSFDEPTVLMGGFSQHCQKGWGNTILPERAHCDGDGF